MSNTYPWNKSQKTIFWKKSDDIPHYSKMEYIHRQIHKLLQVDNPINRLELLELCENHIVHHTRQDWQRHISDYKRYAVEADVLELHDPWHFIRDNPIENMGINFCDRGGYALYDEALKEIACFKTNDEAIQFVMEHPEWSHKIKEETSIETGLGTFIPDAEEDLNVTMKEIRQQGPKAFSKPSDNINKSLEADAEAMLNNIEIE